MVTRLSIKLALFLTCPMETGALSVFAIDDTAVG